MNVELFRNLSPEDVLQRPQQAVDSQTLAAASDIIADIRRGGREALLEYGRRFGDLGPGDRLYYDRPELDAALARLPADQQDLLSPRPRGRPWPTWIWPSTAAAPA